MRVAPEGDSVKDILLAISGLLTVVCLVSVEVDGSVFSNHMTGDKEE